MFALWGGQYTAFMTWLPDYLVARFGLGADHAAAVNALSVLGVLASCLVTGWLLRRGVPLGVLFTGASLVQAAVWIAAPSLGPWGGLAVVVAYGAVAGAPPTCMFAVPGRLLGPRRADTAAFAPLMTGRSLGVLMAPVAAGWLIDWQGWGAMNATFAVTTLVAAACGAVMAFLSSLRAGTPRPGPRDAKDPERPDRASGPARRGAADEGGSGFRSSAGSHVVRSRG